MSAHSTNIVQTNTDNDVRWILRPIYYILRPGNRLVPLIAHDELPSWLKIVGTYYVDMTKIITVNKDNPYPRQGEYDIICQYCVDATEHMHRNDERRYDANREEQGIEALRERSYAPTGQNQYAQRVPATSETPVQQSRQPQPLRASQPEFVQPGYNHELVQFQQPVQAPQSSQISPSSQVPPSLQMSLSPQISQPAQSRPPPPLLPHISSISPLPSMPSLPSQASGLSPQRLLHAVQQAIQLQSQQPQQQQQLHYTQQQLYSPQQLSQQHPRYLPQQPDHQQEQLNWWQDRGRTRDRDQLRYHPWDYKSPPGQPRCRLLPSAPPRRSRSPIVNLNVRQGEETRGLNATAPAFVPSAAGSGDGSAALINQ
ncbi:hypothetical protein DPV78_012043 [Talaromyces pinophilus]|nr:hypothetical protein DPV78_012043 [Talaromyces pinophilus]